MCNASRSTAHILEALQATNICSHQRLQEPTVHRREPMRAHQLRISRNTTHTPVVSGIADRTMTIYLPRTTANTATRVVGEDVVGSLQHAPSMDSMSSSVSTSPLNFSATRSASRPPSRMPKERRLRGQRGDCGSSARLHQALNGHFWPFCLRPLFWIDARTERLGVPKPKLISKYTTR